VSASPYTTASLPYRNLLNCIPFSKRPELLVSWGLSWYSWILPRQCIWRSAVEIWPPLTYIGVCLYSRSVVSSLNKWTTGQPDRSGVLACCTLCAVRAITWCLHSSRQGRLHCVWGLYVVINVERLQLRAQNTSLRALFLHTISPITFFYRHKKENQFFFCKCF